MPDDKIARRLEELDKKNDNISNNLDRLIDEMTEHRSILVRHIEEDSKLYKSFSEIQSHMSENNLKLDYYNHQLELHIAGVTELKKNNELLREYIDIKNKDIESRLLKIEKPLEWFGDIKHISLWITSIGGAGIMIFSLIKYLIK